MLRRVSLAGEEPVISCKFTVRLKWLVAERGKLQLGGAEEARKPRIRGLRGYRGQGRGPWQKPGSFRVAKSDEESAVRRHPPRYAVPPQSVHPHPEDRRRTLRCRRNEKRPGDLLRLLLLSCSGTGGIWPELATERLDTTALGLPYPQFSGPPTVRFSTPSACSASTTQTRTASKAKNPREPHLPGENSGTAGGCCRIRRSPHVVVRGPADRM